MYTNSELVGVEYALQREIEGLDESGMFSEQPSFFLKTHQLKTSNTIPTQNNSNSNNKNLSTSQNILHHGSSLPNASNSFSLSSSFTHQQPQLNHQQYQQINASSNFGSLPNKSDKNMFNRYSSTNHQGVSVAEDKNMENHYYSMISPTSFAKSLDGKSVSISSPVKAPSMERLASGFDQPNSKILYGEEFAGHSRWKLVSEEKELNHFAEESFAIEKKIEGLLEGELDDFITIDISRQQPHEGHSHVYEHTDQVDKNDIRNNSYISDTQETTKKNVNYGGRFKLPNPSICFDDNNMNQKTSPSFLKTPAKPNRNTSNDLHDELNKSTSQSSFLAETRLDLLETIKPNRAVFLPEIATSNALEPSMSSEFLKTITERHVSKIKEQIEGYIEDGEGVPQNTNSNNVNNNVFIECEHLEESSQIYDDNPFNISEVLNSKSNGKSDKAVPKLQKVSFSIDSMYHERKNKSLDQEIANSNLEIQKQESHFSEYQNDKYEKNNKEDSSILLSLQDRIDSLELERNEAKNRIDQLEQELQHAKNKLSGQHSTLHAMRESQRSEERNKIQEALNSAKVKVDALEKEIEDMGDLSKFMQQVLPKSHSVGVSTDPELLKNNIETTTFSPSDQYEGISVESAKSVTLDAPSFFDRGSILTNDDYDYLKSEIEHQKNLVRAKERGQGPYWRENQPSKKLPVKLNGLKSNSSNRPPIIQQQRNKAALKSRPPNITNTNRPTSTSSSTTSAVALHSKKLAAEISKPKTIKKSVPIGNSRAAYASTTSKTTTSYSSTARKPTTASVLKSTKSSSGSSKQKSSKSAAASAQKNMPFVVGKNTGKSYSVTANIQKVFSMLKAHHPSLCNVCSQGLSHADQVYEEENEGYHHQHDTHQPKKASEQIDDEGVHALHQVLDNLEREFSELKSEYNQLVLQYDAQAEANRLQQSTSSSSRPSTATLESKRLVMLGDRLREVIQLMDVKSEQMSILKDILETAVHRSVKNKALSNPNFNQQDKPTSVHFGHADATTPYHKATMAAPVQPSRKVIANLALLKSTRKIQENLRKSVH